MNLKNRIISKTSLNRILPRWRKENKKIVFTNGCFDIIHSGHIKSLKYAKSCGDILIVGLNSDSSIKKIKGPNRPINKFKDRATVLSAIRYVDYVIGFKEKTPYNLIKSIKPDVLVKGGDYSLKEIVGREFAAEVRVVKLLKGRSTTKIIEKVSNKS